VKQDVGAAGAIVPTRELAGRVADAADARDEDHANGTEPRHHRGVVPGATWQMSRRKAERGGGGFDRLLHLWSCERRFGTSTRRHLDPCIRVRGDLSCTVADVAREQHYFRAVEVAQFDRQPHDTRHDVGHVRDHVQLTDGPDLPAGLAAHDLVNRQRRVGGGDQRIAAIGHRGRTRVIAEAPDFDFVPCNGDDAVHHANGDAGVLKRAAMFDVQIEIAVEGALVHLRPFDARRVATDLRWRRTS